MLVTIRFSFLQPFSHVLLRGIINIITVIMLLSLRLRLQEAIISTPRDITRLMDMLMDRDV